MADVQENAEVAEPERSKAERRWLNESIVVSIIVVLGYSLAYKYEQGVCEFYRLPVDVIDLTLWAIVAFTIRVFGVLFIVTIISVSFCNVLLNSTLRELANRAYRSVLLKWVFLLLLAIPHLFVDEWVGRCFYFALLGCIFVFDVVLPIRRRGDKTRLAAVCDAQRAEAESERHVCEHLPRGITWLLLASILVWNTLGIATSAGKNAAARSRQYNCLTLESRTYAILRIYDDVAYCGEIAADKKQLTGRYRAVSLAGQEWEQKRVGPLKPPITSDGDAADSEKDD